MDLRLNATRSINLSVYLVFELEAGRFKFLGENLLAAPQAAQALFMNHTRIQHNMASNYKGLYGVFYKITTKVVKSVNIQ